MDAPDSSGRFPFTSFPDGWFFFELSRNMPAGKLVGRQWMGRQVVGWRDGAGRICVADAFCPHLGARLSPETGGVIEDGKLVCPFHGFTYDVSGACVSTPNAPPTAACRLALYPAREVNGFVFAWYDKAEREPRWRLPVMDEAGWTPTATHRYRIRSHPQETTENTIDLNHLRVLHEFEAVRQVGRSELRGPHFRTRFRFEGSYNIPILRKARFELAAAVDIWGLGFLFVDTHAPPLGVRTMNWFLTTPVDGERVDILVSAKVRSLEKFDSASRSIVTTILRFLPGVLRQRLLHPLVMYEFKKNIEKDFVVWDNKMYSERPLLNRADGEIMKFRNYCRQFYPEQGGQPRHAGRAPWCGGRTGSVTPGRRGQRRRRTRNRRNGTSAGVDAW